MDHPPTTPPPGSPPPLAVLPEPEAPRELKKCPTCGTTGTRSLVVCIDGTSNQFSIKNTNVVELYSRLVKDHDQRTFYNSGIGTYAKPHGLTPSQHFMNTLDLAIAWRFDKVLLSAYRWLSENYEEGDRIFLFGFSRGAYQVRALSAMIEDVGLIHKGNQDQIPFAYKLYADVKSRTVSATTLSKFEALNEKLGRLFKREKTAGPEETVNMAERFKNTFSRSNIKVHFVGVWDTVSSVGVVYDKTLPGTTDGMPHVCFIRHALAIHERRVKFLPEFVNHCRKNNTIEGESGGMSGDNHMHGGHDESESHSVNHGDMPARLKEVWFAGSHSDIGGGIVENTQLNQFGPSLRWMSYEGRYAGLRLGDPPRWSANNAQFAPYRSLAGLWWILEFLPLTRPSANPNMTSESVRTPHLGGFRTPRAGQLLHATAQLILREDTSFSNPWLYLDIELDPYLNAQYFRVILSKQPPRLSEEQIAALKGLLATDAGRISLRDAVTSWRKDSGQRTAVRVGSEASLLEPAAWGDAVLPTLQGVSSMYARDGLAAQALDVTSAFFKHIPITLSYHDHYLLFRATKDLSRQYSSSAKQLLQVVMAVEPRDFAPAPIPKTLTRAVFIPGEPRVVVCTTDSVVRAAIWDYSVPADDSGSMRKFSLPPLAGLSVSKNGALIALSSLRGTFTWDSRTRELRHPTDAVAMSSEHSLAAVALNPAGDRVIVCGENGGVFSWSTHLGDICTLLPDWSSEVQVGTVTWSDDGRFTAAALESGMVYVWDMKPKDPTLIFHHSSDMRSLVNCVAFSSDNATVVVGTRDNGMKAYSVQQADRDDGVKVPSVLQADRDAPSVQQDQDDGTEAPNVLQADSPKAPSVRRIMLGPPSSEEITNICFSSDGYYIACTLGGRRRCVRMIDTRNGVAVFPDVDLPSRPLAVAFSPDVKALRIFCRDGGVRLIFWTFEG